MGKSLLQNPIVDRIIHRIWGPRLEPTRNCWTPTSTRWFEAKTSGTSAVSSAIPTTAASQKKPSTKDYSDLNQTKYSAFVSRYIIRYIHIYIYYTHIYTYIHDMIMYDYAWLCVIMYDFIFIYCLYLYYLILCKLCNILSGRTTPNKALWACSTDFIRPAPGLWKDPPPDQCWSHWGWFPVVFTTWTRFVIVTLW